MATATDKARRPTLERTDVVIRRHQTPEDLAAAAALEAARVRLAQVDRYRERLQQQRERIAQTIAECEKFLGDASILRDETAAEIAILETRCAARDRTALEAVIRERTRAWVAARCDKMTRRLNLTVVQDLKQWEPQLLTLAPAVARVAVRYPRLGDALELLLDEVHMWHLMEGDADVLGPVRSPHDVSTAFALVSRFLATKGPMIAPFLCKRLWKVIERIDVPLSWRGSDPPPSLTGREDHLLRWFIDVAGLHAGLGLDDVLEPEKLAPLLEPERIARELKAQALGCVVMAEVVDIAGVRGYDLDRTRSDATAALTALVCKYTDGQPLNGFVYELIRVGMPKATARCGTRGASKTRGESYVRRWLAAHRRDQAAEESSRTTANADRPRSTQSRR